MLSDITLGQFFPGKSLIHRVDPRMKIVLLVAYIVLIFCAFNYVSLGIIVATIIAVMVLSGVPIRQYLKSLKMILIIIIITSILNLFYGTGPALVTIGPLSITLAGINNAVFICVRIICLIIASCALTFTTSPTDLTDAIERLLKPLTVFHLKVHELAMMMTIALRFVPTLLEETDKIMSAQKARGADMESGNIVKRAKALIPVLIPLFVSAFRKAFELAMAMECRCYQGGSGRTRMKSLKLSKTDLFTAIFMVLLIAGVVICNVFLKKTIR